MLTNINDIKNWLKNYVGLNENQFEINNETLIINTFCDTYVKFENNVVPIKFGTINGDFGISTFSIKKDLLKNNSLNFDFLPTHVFGNLIISDLPLEQEYVDNWNIKYIKGYINMCSRNANLTNLDFLENTEFDHINLIIADTPFKDNIIPEQIKNHKKKDNENLTKKELMEIIINKEIILDYFDFNTNNIREIK